MRTETTRDEYRENQHQITKKSISFKERLDLSAITLVAPQPLPAKNLTSNTSSMILNWRNAIERKLDFFVPTPPPTNLAEMAVASTLTSLFLNNVKSSRHHRDDSEYKYIPSEIDYIVKYASILLQNMFCGMSDVSIDWDAMSDSLKDSVPLKFKNIRPDLTLITSKGYEVGCGEIKPFGKVRELVEIDRARIAEICKRQLHKRMKVSVSLDEHTTFGILLAGDMLELTQLKYNEDKYQYCVLKKLKLLGREKLYANIELAFEALIAFKERINESWTGQKSAHEENWFEDNFSKLKPTVRFMDS